MAGNPLDELDAPQAPSARATNPLDEYEAPTPQGVPTSFLQGFNKAVANVATSPFQAIHAGAEHARDVRKSGIENVGPVLGTMEAIDRYLPKAFYSGAYLEPPEPGTTAEKFARSTGENIGYSVLPEAGLVGKAERLAKVAPATAPRALAQQIGEQYATKPARAVVGSTAAAGASGIGSEAAREAELGPGWEIAAGGLTPVAAIGAPITAVRTGRRLLRIPSDAFTPTAERWRVNANDIFRKLGISMSADGTQAGETAGGQAAAYMLLANVLRRANVPIDQLDTLLSRIAESRRFYSGSYAPDATMLVDLDPALQKFAGSLMRENPEVWKRAVDLMYARQTGVTPPRGEGTLAGAGIPARERMAPPIKGEEAREQYGTTFGTPLESVVPMGQRERVGDAFKRAMRIEDVDFHGHAPTADMTDAQLIQLAQDASRPKYDAARAAGQGVDLRSTLEPILQRWETAIADQPGPVRAQLARQIREVRQAIEPRAPSQPGAPVRGTASPFERFDNWKKYLDADIGKYYGSDKTHNKVTGNALQTFKKELLEGVRDPNDPNNLLMPGVDHIADNNLGNLYADARATFSSVADARRALQTGRDIWSGKAGLDEFHALEGDDASQKLVRLGMHGGYMQDTANMPRGNDVTRLFDKPRLDEVLSEIIPRSQGNRVFSNTPQRFGQYLANEQMMSGTAKRTYQGSPTAERIADDKAANELFALTDQLKSGGVRQVISNFAANTLNKMFGYRADTAATLGRVLFTADPAQRAQAIYQIRQYMGPDRFTYFQRLMGAQAKRFAESAGVSAPEATNQQQSGQTP